MTGKVPVLSHEAIVSQIPYNLINEAYSFVFLVKYLCHGQFHPKSNFESIRTETNNTYVSFTRSLAFWWVLSGITIGN